MKSKFQKSFVSRQYGQGMTEYIVITALIAIAAIGAFTFFGGAAREQIAGMATELSGQDAKTQIGNAGKEAGLAQAQGGQTTKKGLATYNGN